MWFKYERPESSEGADRSAPSTIGATPSGCARHVRGMQSLLAGVDLELHELAFGERLEAIHLDGRKVHEHIFAAFLFDESVAFCVVEPLHFTLGHATASQRLT